MTTLNVADERITGTDARTVSWRDLVWVAWRQHRGLLIASAFVTAFVVAVLLVYAAMFHHYAGCARGSENAAGQRCFDNYRISARRFADILRTLIFLPALAGAFWGAPLVAAEVESGTIRLALGQDVTPRRWLVAQATTLACALTGFALIVATAARVAVPEAMPTNEFSGDRFDTKIFETAPWTFTAYALLSLGLGIAISTAMHRVVPAMALTVGAFFACWVVLRDVRPRYLTPKVSTVYEADYPKTAAWRVYRYQPQSRARLFEFIEAGLCVSAAVVLIGIAVEVFHRRRAHR